MCPIKKELEVETSQMKEYTCSFIPEYVLEAILKSSSTRLDSVCRSSVETSINAARDYHKHRGCEDKNVSFYSFATYCNLN